MHRATQLDSGVNEREDITDETRMTLVIHRTLNDSTRRKRGLNDGILMSIRAL